MATEKSSNKKAATPKVMDVSKPGKSTPSTTSKPVIVGHRPMIQDPMVNEKNSSEAEKKEEKLVPRGPKVIIPLTSIEAETPKKYPEEPKPATPAPDPPKPADPEPEKPAAEPEPEQESKETKPEAESTEPETPAKSDPEPEPPKTEEAPKADEASTDKETKPDENSAENGVVDAFAEQAVAKKQQSTEDAEAAKRQEALDKLVEEKKYFVPIGQVTHRRRTRWAILLLVLVLLAAGGVYAIDAGMVDPGFDLPFNLIEE